MSSYTTTQIENVKEVIDKYTSNTLDNYIISTVHQIATETMKKGASVIEVADAVFDYLHTYHCGNITNAMMCKQICPKNVLLVLRNDIIVILKQNK